ncbi:Sel1 repeat family protein [Rhizophagus clarus]|uniref:Sel1 repeat family protein n=1 Tax=Rhizophagus clarus TaxID=94130 RepID=A0A8H3LP23_9GLOM|nr:Sel1 repeat family protein [Rhizophagus clarus]
MDIEKAIYWFYWFSRTAENGEKAAQYNLGVFYDDGIGQQKKNSKGASYKLGELYELGKGVCKNNARAFVIYKQTTTECKRGCKWNI